MLCGIQIDPLLAVASHHVTVAQTWRPYGALRTSPAIPRTDASFVHSNGSVTSADVMMSIAR